MAGTFDDRAVAYTAIGETPERENGIFAGFTQNLQHVSNGLKILREKSALPDDERQLTERIEATLKQADEAGRNASDMLAVDWWRRPRS
ncbi:hypothetical protein CCP2SC5_2430002 [Azospirillaceae bacterium]